MTYETGTTTMATADAEEPMIDRQALQGSGQCPWLDNLSCDGTADSTLGRLAGLADLAGG